MEERRGAAVHKQLCLITGGHLQHLSLPEAPELGGRATAARLRVFNYLPYV